MSYGLLQLPPNAKPIQPPSPLSSTTPLPALTPDKVRAIRIVAAHSKIPRSVRLAWFDFLATCRRHQIATRILCSMLVIALAAVMYIEFFMAQRTVYNYSIDAEVTDLIGSPVKQYADKLTFENKSKTYLYNADFSPNSNAAGPSSQPKFTAEFGLNQTYATKITDPVNNVSVSFMPLFGVDRPIKRDNRVVYPVQNREAMKIYTLKASTVKEDIVLKSFQGDTVSFAYKVNLSEGLEAKVERSGQLSVYGTDPRLLGNVSTSNQADADLLAKARANGKKTQLIFRIPAPYVVERGKPKSSASASYSYRDGILTVTAHHLRDASYPLSIDPSVYIETAAKFMRGNNESNIDFDVDNELIQKSQTTGARIDEWTGTIAQAYSTWDQGVAVAGGYIYSIGGQQVYSKVFNTVGADSFVVPSGVTSVSVKSWGGGGGGGGGAASASGASGGGAGYVSGSITTTPGEVLDVYVGGAGMGGTYSTGGSDAGGGGGGGGYSSVYRSSTPLLIAAGGGGGGGARNALDGGQGGPGGGTSGTAGTASGNGGGGGGGTPTTGGSGGSGGNNNGSSGSSLNGGNGADGRSSQGNDGSGASGGLASGGDGGSPNNNNTRAGGGGGGSGLFGGGGGGASSSSNSAAGGGGGGGSSYIDSGATGTSNQAGSTSAPGNAADGDRAGAGDGGNGGNAQSVGSVGTAGRVIVTYSIGGNATNTTAEVYWAHFNTTTNAIESPNPGSGTCPNWCTNTAYDLPSPRRGFSLIAYNGFLYALGGVDDTGARQSTVYIAKLGANGEPQLWHPTDTNKNNWVYWYTGVSLSGTVAKSYLGAVAYNNRIYVTGGQTNASGGGINTVEMADINPTGILGVWTTSGMQTLPYVLHSHSLQVYNDVMYLVGGNSNGTLKNQVYYAKLNSDGTMNPWVTTNSFTTPRSTGGSNFATIWSGYMYIGGGCSVLSGAYCDTIASDVQLASINADGSIAPWNSILGLSDARIGSTFLAWQDGLYRVGGCESQNTSTGDCTAPSASIDYGVVNPSGDASTVNQSSSSGNGNCTGGSPYDCDLPGSGSIGNMLTGTAILNGYLYIIGGCTNNSCTSMSGNVAYQAIDSNGQLIKPSSCPSGSYVDSYCVDNVNTIGGGIAAPSVTTFGDELYVVGGSDNSNDKGNIYRVSVNSDGSLASGWTSQSFASVGMGTAVSYMYSFTRANPSAASSNPGNLYAIGGCVTGGGPGCSGYIQSVYKCNIATSTAIASCSTSNQLQIGTLPGASGVGLGAHAGTVYANYIYLIGGLAPGLTDLSTVRYAKIDNSNNVVAAAGSTWVESPNQTSIGRRRGAAFGYNGFLYVVGGYDATSGVLSDIQFTKIDVSSGSIEAFKTSQVSINQRWGLSVPVSNSYAYVVGGCTAGASPSNCTSRTDTVQTFQIYNNDSGALASYTAFSDDTFTASTDRWGASAAVLNGYLYVVGGCVSATNCTTTTRDGQYAPISATDGSVGTWSALSGNISTSTAGDGRAWGNLVAIDNALHYVGGIDNLGGVDAKGTTYTGIPNPSTGDIASWSTDTALPDDRAYAGATVWNGRIYVVGGANDTLGTARSTVYYSNDLSGGASITGWTTSASSLPVARRYPAVTAYANNLYVFGGDNGTNYLSDSQFIKINSDGSLGTSWTYSTSLPRPIAGGNAFAANGYMYVNGGRSATSTCFTDTLVAPISANTTIASGNNPTGVGEWYTTNVKYSSARYGAATVYAGGKLYMMGGGCTAPLSSNRGFYGVLKSQPQIAKYSRMIDTDSDTRPTHWLMNGLDNSTGAEWYLRYRSSTNTTAAWGIETIFGKVTLGNPEDFHPLDGIGANTTFARYYFMSVNIDSSQAFGYPEDVTRGPTIADLTLFYSSNPAGRLRHGATFTGGVLQPLDTPF